MRRTLMLFGALWPAIYMVFFVILILEAALRNSGEPDPDLLVPFGLLLTLHIGTMLITLAAAIAYVVHAWRSPRIDKDQRVLWVLVLLLAAPIAMPIYWWLHVRPGDAPVARERAWPTTS